LTWSSTAFAASDLAFCDTHLPWALAPCLPVPYFCVKAAGSAVFSAAHSWEAFCLAALAASEVAWLRLETHLPNALRLDLFVP
jgi:hypothetical protein